MTTRRIAIAAITIIAAMFLSAPTAQASNGAVVPHTDALVTAVSHGHTAGTVSVCVSASGGSIRVVSFRVHDWSRHIYTRMGGGGRIIRTGHRYCARTGNWFRFMRSDVTISVVNADNGGYGWLVMPVIDY